MTAIEIPSENGVACAAASPAAASATPSARPADAEPDAAAAAARRGRLREAADGGDDVQHAHAPGRHGDDDERQQHAERVRDDAGCAA